MSNLQVKVKKLNEKAVIPTYGTDQAAGMDLVAIDDGKPTMTYIEYKTGLAFEIPEGHVGLLFPRSSISSNTTLTLANSVGVVDSDYRGEVTFRFRPMSNSGNSKYKAGDKIGQLVIIPLPKLQLKEVEELSETVRGEGGYGSTGR